LLRTTLIAAAALLAAAALPLSALADGGGRTLFVRSAVEHADGTATFPIVRGVATDGTTVWLLPLDASDGNVAQQLGVNTSQKLANAGDAATQPAVLDANGVVHVAATVDFSPERVVFAPAGFPPASFQPGAVGEAGYSPLLRFADGTIVNAPQIARDQNRDGRIDLRTEAADKVVSIDTARGSVTYEETDGFARGNAVKYVSTEATDPLAAALEDATLAPALDAAPFAGGDGTDSARASLAAFVNGQTGAANPQRQGLNSAVADGLSSLNVLAWKPNQGRYSPLWDVHLAAWTVPVAQRTRQVEFAAVEKLAEDGLVTAPGGGAFGPAGFIVDCPIVSSAG
jgi:hypothetical protein